MQRLAPILLVASACAHGSSSRAAILKARADLDTAFARSDVDGYRAHLWDNVVWCFPGAPEKYLVGAEKIARGAKSLHASRPDILLRYQPATVEVNEAWGVASEGGNWIEQWTEKDGPTALSGPYLGMWRRDGNEWKLQSLVFVPTRCEGSSYCVK